VGLSKKGVMHAIYSNQKSNIRLEPIRKKSTYLKDDVYHTLKNAILVGSLKYGQRITLTEISQILEVSRTPVRDAVTRLEAENLVQSTNKKGILIIGISPKDLRDIFEIRLFLETNAATDVCKKRTKSDLEKLSKLNQAMQNAQIEGNAEKYQFYDDAFHYFLYKVSNKINLYVLLNSLMEYCSFFRSTDNFENMALIKQDLQDHLQLVEAIRARNKHVARKIVEVHLLRLRDALIKDYSDKQYSRLQ
jgi:DNA-binding GntR family transcriptional regulator